MSGTNSSVLKKSFVVSELTVVMRAKWQFVWYRKPLGNHTKGSDPQSLEHGFGETELGNTIEHNDNDIVVANAQGWV